MANCPNCNAPLEDDARFCANCGASIPAAEVPAAEAPAAEAPASESIFCPNCGEPTSAAFEYCEHCGASLSTGGGQKEKKTGGSGMKKWLICGGIVVVAAALVIVLISIFGGGGGGGKSFGLYVKDGEMYYSKLSKNGGWQVTSKLYDDADNSYFRYHGDAISRATIMSKDGKTLFFPDKIDNSGFTLYWRSVTSENSKAERIASGVKRYAVNDSASLVTYLEDGNLYQYNVKNKDKGKKLASDVSTFYVSDDGKTIVFLVYDDGELILNLLASGSDKAEKLDSDVSLRFVSNDCKTIVYMKDGKLILNQGGKGKDTSIDKDVYDTIRVYETGEAYYIKEDDDEYILCYFDGKKTSTELTDEFERYGYYAASDPDAAAMLVYQDDDEYMLVVGGKDPKELDAEEPVAFTFSTDGKNVWYVDDLDKNSEGDLYKVTISNGTVKSTDKVDDEVYAYGVVYSEGGHLIYFKDVKNSEGELWVDGAQADDEVYLGSFQESESGALLYYVDYNFNKGYGMLKQYSGKKAKEIADEVDSFYVLPNGSILYLSEYNSNKYRGDLYIYSGNKAAQLDEDVVTILPAASGKYGYYSNDYYGTGYASNTGAFN